MKIISHRGNLTGSKPECENNPTYIQQALDLGFDVEVDVWYVDGEFFLGHDAPTYHVEKDWFDHKFLWCHAKNQEALEQLWSMNLLLGTINYFWHENDRMTLTSQGIPWLFPGNYSEFGVTVHVGKPDEIFPVMGGVCTDYPVSWMNVITRKERV
jgi:hypothetical protein